MENRIINSKTQCIGLIGHPVEHSRSPEMHNMMFETLGLEYMYLAFNVAINHLQSAIEGVRALNIRGLNVTIPHKVQVMDYLDEISPEAKRIGAVNTIVNQDGHLIGYNTDGQGYLRSLLEETNVDLNEKRIVLLGAGGAARAIAYSFANSPIQELTIINRNEDKAHILAQDLKQYTNTKVLPIDDLEFAVRKSDIIVNTTSIGMAPNINESPILKSWIQSNHIVSDIIYNPLETKLIQEAREQGARVHSGLGMFIYQGVIAFEKWTGITPDAHKMRETVVQTMK